MLCPTCSITHPLIPDFSYTSDPKAKDLALLRWVQIISPSTLQSQVKVPTSSSSNHLTSMTSNPQFVCVSVLLLISQHSSLWHLRFLFKICDDDVFLSFSFYIYSFHWPEVLSALFIHDHSRSFNTNSTFQNVSHLLTCFPHLQVTYHHSSSSNSPTFQVIISFSSFLSPSPFLPLFHSPSLPLSPRLIFSLSLSLCLSLLYFRSHFTTVLTFLCRQLPRLSTIKMPKTLQQWP